MKSIHECGLLLFAFWLASCQLIYDVVFYYLLLQSVHQIHQFCHTLVHGQKLGLEKLVRPGLLKHHTDMPTHCLTCSQSVMWQKPEITAGIQMGISRDCGAIQQIQKLHTNIATSHSVQVLSHLWQYIYTFVDQYHHVYMIHVTILVSAYIANQQLPPRLKLAYIDTRGYTYIDTRGSSFLLALPVRWESILRLVMQFSCIEIKWVK
jgi:hypothetical protein